MTRRREKALYDLAYRVMDGDQALQAEASVAWAAVPPVERRWIAGLWYLRQAVGNLCPDADDDGQAAVCDALMAAIEGTLADEAGATR